MGLEVVAGFEFWFRHTRTGFGGPQCQGLDVSFGGTGWAWYEPLATCAAGPLTLTLTTRTANGLLLYAGPVAAGGVAANAVVAAAASDFVALELSHGAPVLHIDLGSGTKRLDFGDQVPLLLLLLLLLFSLYYLVHL